MENFEEYSNGVIERLNQFMGTEKLTDRSLSLLIGMHQSTINKSKSNHRISWEIIEKISIAYPYLNLRWLLSGHEKMRQEEDTNSENSIEQEEVSNVGTSMMEVIKMQAESMLEKDKQISQLLKLINENQSDWDARSAACAAAK